MKASITFPNLSITEANQELLIEKKWSRVTGGVLLGFSIIWTGVSSFIGFGFFGSMFDFADAPTVLVIIPIVFGLIPLLFILIGVVFFYAGLCMLYNKSKIKVDAHFLQVQSGPLPLMPKQRIPIELIEQIYVHEQSQSNNNKHGTSYQLSFIHQNGEAQLLLGKLWVLPISLPTFELDEAQHLERVLEDYMRIENKAVAIEVGKQQGQMLNEEIESSNKSYWKNKELADTEPNSEEGIHPKTEEIEASSFSSIEQPNSLKTANPLLAPPSSLVVEQSSDGLFILKKWRNPIIFFFLVFAIIWNTAILGIASFLVPPILSGASLDLLIPLLFTIPFIGVGIWIAYMSIAVVFNSTHIFIHQNSFRLSHRPLPAGRGLNLNTEDIIDIDIRVEQRSGKNGPYQVYFLEAIDQQGFRHNMNIRNQFMRWSKEEATFIQKRIKLYLQL